MNSKWKQAYNYIYRTEYGPERSVYSVFTSFAYPTLIRGHVDPFQWAGNVCQCNDCYDTEEEYGSVEAVISGYCIITGVPGSAG